MQAEIAQRRRSADRALAAQKAVSRALAEARSPQDALPHVLEAICDALDWHVAAAWLIDDGSRTLRLADFWRSKRIRMDGFESSSRALAIPFSAGLPGQVWASRGSVWIEDLSRNRNHPRATAAARSGLRSGFAVPVRAGHSIYGVLEFYADEPRPLQADMLEMMEVVGGQVGLFLQFQRGEESLRASEERYRLLYNGVGEAIIVYNVATQRVMDVNDAAVSLYRYSRAELARMTIDGLFAPGERSSRWPPAAGPGRSAPSRSAETPPPSRPN